MALSLQEASEFKILLAITKQIFSQDKLKTLWKDTTSDSNILHHAGRYIYELVNIQFIFQALKENLTKDEIKELLLTVTTDQSWFDKSDGDIHLHTECEELRGSLIVCDRCDEQWKW